MYYFTGVYSRIKLKITLLQYYYVEPAVTITDHILLCMYTNCYLGSISARSGRCLASGWNELIDKEIHHIEVG